MSHSTGQSKLCTMLFAICVIKCWIISFVCPFFFFPPSNTDDLRMSDDERISSSFETRAQTRRFDFLMQLFPFVLFWLIIFTNSAQLLTDLNRLRQTGCANVSWICVPLRTGSKLRDTDDVKSFEPNAPAMSSV